MNEILDIYQRHPYYGYRRIHVVLRKLGFEINQKLVRRLLKKLGIEAIYPKKKTSIRNQKHKIYPYLLKDLLINRPNQVWQVDITYIKMKYGFVYLVCLIDVFSRKIMGWALSTTLETESSQNALKNALKSHKPEIINSDQGCQFTSDLWCDFLTQHGIIISLDGKGRCLDNIYIERFWRTYKYESVFLYCYENVNQARKILGEFIAFYNKERPHQSLNYHTPNAIFELGKVPSKQQLFEQFRLQHQAKQREAAMI